MLGLIILLVGIGLFWKKELLEKNGIGGLAKARWIITMLGACSTYSGLIYNEFMSLKIPFFGTCNPDFKVKTPDCMYPFGFDWIWGISGTEITFFNSYRTKFSVIVGFLQMSFGIILKGIHFLSL
jgi:V-type H+-transporting ATPase subunit a